MGCYHPKPPVIYTTENQLFLEFGCRYFCPICGENKIGYGPTSKKAKSEAKKKWKQMAKELAELRKKYD